MRAEQKEKPGAIFHFACKVHGRSTGANAVRLAAYRAGERLRSELTGRIHNFTEKRSVLHRQSSHQMPTPRHGHRPWPALEHRRHMEARKDAQLAT